MKTVALIPYWSEYSFPNKSIKHRDTIKIGGRALINYTIEVASHIHEIDDIVIYSSNNEVFNLIEESFKCKFLKRDRTLDSQKVSIEDIIDAFLKESDADIIVLLHPKNPFLKKETIFSCIEKVKSSLYDSAFVVSKANKLAWYKGNTLNYSLDRDTPSSSSIEPIVLESSSVYVFTRELFQRTHSRIGPNSFMVEIGHFEGLEVDRKDDYLVAELIINSGLEYI